MNENHEKEEWGAWKIVSDMLDKPDENGIYPTSECYQKLYEFVCNQKQQLLESLEEDYKEMRKKSKVDEVLKECDSEWHEGFLVGIERFEALIQSKKTELL